MTVTTRRDTLATLAGFIAVPVASATALSRPSPGSDYEARFLALVPWLARVVPEAEALAERVHALYRASEEHAGDHPGWERPVQARAWAARCNTERERNGYREAWAAMSAAVSPIDVAVEPFMQKRMRTLSAVLWKARLASLIGSFEEEAVGDVAALAREGTLCA
ncbi:hypothetical protein [Methylobacterium dankookense]|uniref:Uncharacterized protein n=1 Tax=Methylobacterium dankookense TaxID=560405 RepID=A0A564G6H1_9HYPH|nr:hypothetical protein [Methylobacterium dankookense]GJD58369.1 hypothetical protein IFDJLNFL_4288 [Methylobacterium dankookense]VUF15626.1 hypothetical protein MTDSW087_05370 [Methylobacterium dankookense]